MRKISGGYTITGWRPTYSWSRESNGNFHYHKGEWN